uniref:Putative phospholipase a2 group xvi n=1 Tax=Amblyomma aureolatum TaxID=187763 RepID=A0A1E1X8G3_9ACAR
MPQQQQHSPEVVVRYGLGSFVPANDLRPEPGDLIEIDRTLYAHWALYAGNGDVVHVVGRNEEDIPTDFAYVHLSKLTDVAGYSGVRVNNKEVRAKERGLVPSSATETLERAYTMLDREVEFNFLTRNGEYYVTQWKFGIGWSDQATVTLSVMKPLAKNLQVGHTTFLAGLQAVFGTPTTAAIARIAPNSPRTPQKNAPTSVA